MLGWVGWCGSPIRSVLEEQVRAEFHAAPRLCHLLDDLNSVGYECESKEDDSEDAENEVGCVTLRCG